MKPLHLTPLLLAAACAVQPDQDAVWADLVSADVLSSAAPTGAPPPVLDLCKPVQAIPGVPTSVTVSGLPPGASVYLAAGFNDGGSYCPSFLHGSCVEVRNPRPLGPRTADANGDATFPLTVPPSVAPGNVAFLQAVYLAGPNSTTSNVVGMRVVADAGDLSACADADICAQPDVDGDDVPDVCEVAGCTDGDASNYDAAATDEDGSCLYAVTFELDTNCVASAFTTPYVTGANLDGWCGNCIPLTDGDSDGVYTVTLDLPPGDHDYKYTLDGWAGEENLINDAIAGGTCVENTDFFSYANRQANVVDAPLTEPATFDTCDACVPDTDTVVDTDTDLPGDTILVDFDGAPPVLTGFGGAEDASVVVDPAGGPNLVGRVLKSDTAELWAGATVSYCPANGIAVLPFSASATTMSVRVYSPDAGIPVRLKVEDSGNQNVSVETEAFTTVANAWETLFFDFSNQATGTAALNLGSTYDKVSIFFNFGTTGAAAGAKTYFMDDITFLGASFPTDCPVTGTAEGLPLTFDDAGTTYALTGFGGAEQAAVVPDPDDAGNNVAEIVKSATAELWAGTTMSTGPSFSVQVIPITALDTRMSLRVRSPRAGIPVRLKIEDAADNTHSVETEALTTGVDTWETLVFDFATEAPGTAALNPGYTFNKVSVFFDFGTAGGDGGGGTFYCENLDMAP